MSGCKDCTKFEKQLKLLQEQNNFLQFELAEIKAKLFNKSKKKKPPKQDPPSPEPNKKGGVFGHSGWFRKKPKRIDKIEEVRLSKCPECGCKNISLCHDKNFDDHIQEDIILPRTETTLYRKYRYYCKNCKKTVIGRGCGETRKSYIGPLAKALAAFLKYDVKVSDNDIKKIFDKMFGLKVVTSSIIGIQGSINKRAKAHI